MKKTNFTFHSLTRATNWCLSLILLFVGSLSVSAQTPCNLVCNDHVNASMPADGCERKFEAADFLNNPDPTCDYVVELAHPLGTNNNVEDGVDRSHIGYTFIYKVVAQDGNSCWGYVTVEDKAAPIGECKSRTVTCFQLSTIQDALGEVIDNCAEASPPAKIEKLTVAVQGNGCDSVYIAKVYRTIRTWDPWGNTSTCLDTLSIKRDSLHKVKCPDVVPLECAITISEDKKKVLEKALGSAISVTTLKVNGNTIFKITFSDVEGTANYPTPTLLLELQKQGCIPKDTLVVPAMPDSVLVIDPITDECIAVDSCVPMWPLLGGVCKTTVGYWDKPLTICGEGFKIRREWRIANWCTGKDTVCVQYIKVEDTQAPMIIKTPDAVNTVASAHDCFARVNVGAYEVMDCSPVKQNFILTYSDPGHPGKNVVISGTLPVTGLKVPAIGGAFGGCAIMDVRLVDECYHTTTDVIRVCVEDITPPTPVCDETTQTTVDPNTCWARVYAHDLDNGSRDNCCNVLHFAVADMAVIEATRKEWVNYWTANCNAEYWKYKGAWDDWLEVWINVFIFKDYIDLTECGTNQVVLRVYEACGVPRYDPHVFPCSEHDWFTYNTYKLARRWHNYTWFDKDGAKKCDAKFGPVCKPNDWTPRTTDFSWGTYKAARYTGATKSTVGSELNEYDCKFVNLDQEANASGYNPAPGNRCSARLYNDCMINILVDDKTPPIAENPDDLFWYCDNVGTSKDNELEYAHYACDDKGDYKDNQGCVDSKGNPYKRIEANSENEADGGSLDWVDGVGKAYGYYGCKSVGLAHNDAPEHGDINPPCSTDKWSPIYCRTWLILDKSDQAGKVSVTSNFAKPWLVSYGTGDGKATPAAGYPATKPDGYFEASDNCWIDDKFDVKTDSFVDKCGNGWYKRTWKFYDKCKVGYVEVDQKIYTKHRSDFEVLFPEDKIQTCEGDNTHPDVTGRPMIMDDECELVGVNYDDVRYDIVADACYKIVRTWTIIDWCKYDPNQHNRYADVIVNDTLVASLTDRYCTYRNLKDDGDGYMKYVQIIKVQDNEQPVTSCKDTTVCYYGGYNGAGDEPTGAMCSVPSFTSPDFAGTDNCTPASQISFRFEVDYLSDGTIDFKSGPNMKRFTSSSLTDGKHKLYVIAEDNCGNEDTASCYITILDCKKPTPYCYNGIATVVMPNNKEVAVWAKDLNAGSYDNCTRKADLKYTFAGKDSAASRTFTCADIPNGVSATVEVDIYVTDAAGNTDFCRTYLLIQDGSGNACVDQAAIAASISGKIATEATEPVENVVLDVKSSNAIPAFKTASNGSYAFSGLSMKGDYSITPKRDDDPTNGVSTVDLVLIQKHILGVQPLNSAYKVIAADADRSNDVSAVDLVELRKLVLTVYDKLPNNTSWRFVPKSYNFSNIQNPWGFPEKLDINSLSKDEIARDFIGIKVGDVNGNVVPHSLLGAEAREVGGTLKFRTLDRELKAGEEAVVEFTAENFNNIEGYQFSMALKGLELKSVKGGKLNVSETNFGMTKLGAGYLTTSWNDSKAVSVSNNDVLFTMTVKATKATKLSESLVINSKYTRAEAYNGQENLGVSLEIGKKAVAGYVLHQNTPNPFKSTTMISYELAKSENVTIKITDVTGKLVRSYQRDGQKGYNQLTINRSDISGAGVLYYTVETKDFSATKKMIVVE